MNKKGFTLVELLAVIVILAIVMLIGITSIGPMMAKSRKSALGTEGIALIKAATSAYSTENLKGTNALFTSTSSVCFNIKYLCENGYFEKGCGNDDYTGSVLVKYANGTYEYYFWLSNGTYTFNAANETTSGDIENTTIVYEDVKASTDCGKTISTTVPSEIKSNIKTANASIINSSNSIVTLKEVSSGDTNSWKAVKNITFKIESTKYTAEEGMTWYEWANSDYNTSNYVCGSNNCIVATKNISKGGASLRYNGKDVRGYDAIINNNNYYAMIVLPEIEF